MLPSDRGTINTSALNNFFTNVKSLSTMKPEDIMQYINEPSINDVYNMTEEYTGINAETIFDNQSAVASSINNSDSIISSNLSEPNIDFDVGSNDIDIFENLLSQSGINSSMISSLSDLESLDARAESQLDELVTRYVEKAVDDIVRKAHDWVESSITNLSNQLSSSMSLNTNNAGQIAANNSSWKIDDMISDFSYDSISNDQSFNDVGASLSNTNSYHYDSWLNLEGLNKYDNPTKGYDTKSFIMSDLLDLSGIKPESFNAVANKNNNSDMDKGIESIKNLGPQLNTAISQSTLPNLLQSLPVTFVGNTVEPFTSSLSDIINELNKKR